MVVVLFMVIPKKEVAFDHESEWQYCNMVRNNSIIIDLNIPSMPA